MRAAILQIGRLPHQFPRCFDPTIKHSVMVRRKVLRQSRAGRVLLPGRPDQKQGLRWPDHHRRPHASRIDHPKWRTEYWVDDFLQRLSCRRTSRRLRCRRATTWLDRISRLKVSLVVSPRMSMNCACCDFELIVEWIRFEPPIAGDWQAGLIVGS